MGEAAGLRLERRDGPDGYPRLVASGEIDLAGAPAFAKAIAGAIHDHASPVFVDLSAVSFLDSSGLDVLLQANRLAAAAGAELIIERPSEPCRTVMELTGLDHVLEIATDGSPRGQHHLDNPAS